MGPEALEAILKLNRIDERHARAGDTLVVPDSLPAPPGLAPLPDRLAGLDSLPRLIFVSLRVQAFGAYEFGNLVRWGPTSTGRRHSPTPTGLFSTNWKSREIISSEDSCWVLKWFFNIMADRGISIHQFDLPGYPASHACVRLLEQDAWWLYGWAQQWILAPDGVHALAYGTPVVIFGTYTWGKRGPWTRLPEDPDAARVSSGVADSAMAPYLGLVLQRARARDSVERSR